MIGGLTFPILLMALGGGIIYAIIGEAWVIFGKANKLKALPSHWAAVRFVWPIMTVMALVQMLWCRLLYPRLIYPAGRWLAIKHPAFRNARNAVAPKEQKATVGPSKVRPPLIIADED